MRALLAVLPVFTLAACGASATTTENAGPSEQRNFDARGFTAVELKGADQVDVTVGPDFAVHATGPKNVLDALDIKVEGGALKVSRKSRHSLWPGNWGNAHITVSMPSIERAAIGGAGDLKIDKVEGQRFSAAISGAGDMTVDRIAGQQVTLDLTGSGDLTAKGKADALKASLAGAGNIDAAGLQVRSADVTLRGVGDLSATASETATVELRGVGSVSIKGGARCSVTKSGIGSVDCG